MIFSEYAMAQGVTPNHPIIDIIDAAIEYYELNHPMPVGDYEADWWEKANGFADRAADRYAGELDESLAEVTA